MKFKNKELQKKQKEPFQKNIKQKLKQNFPISYKKCVEGMRKQIPGQVKFSH